ncbi:MAG: LCP family protein [Kineosporiaceae bacterium]
MSRHTDDGEPRPRRVRTAPSPAPTEPIEPTAPTASTESTERPAAAQAPGAGAGWNSEAPDTVMLPLGEITSRRARRLAEQAAAEAAAQLVDRSQPIIASRSWTEDTMPLPRIGRHASGPVEDPGSPSSPAAAPAPSTSPSRTGGAGAEVATSRPQTRRQRRPDAAAPSSREGDAPRTLPGPPSIAPLGSGAPLGRGQDAPPRHESRGPLRGVRLTRKGVVAATALLLVIAGATGAVLMQLLSGGSGRDSAAGQPVAAPQDTMLVSVEAPGQGLVTGAVVGIGRDGLGALLVPGSLVLEVPGAGRTSLSTATAQGPSVAARALADALAVRVDGTWSLSPTGLSALVDALGGIVVDVDQQVSSGTTVVPAGPGQRLAGVQAVAVATAKSDNEAEEARLARFQQVLRGVLRALPDGADELAPLVQTRAGASSTTFTNPALVELLLRAHRAVLDGQESSSVVPLSAVSAAGQTIYTLDETALPGVVARQLPGAVVAAAAAPTLRVRLQNGVGVAGLNDAARDRLVAAGIKVEASGNAPQFGQPVTRVLVASDSAADQATGRRIAAALGLPKARIAVDPLGSGVVDALVVLGQDFRESIIDEAVSSSAGSSTP